MIQSLVDLMNLLTDELYVGLFTAFSSLDFMDIPFDYGISTITLAMLFSGLIIFMIYMLVIAFVPYLFLKLFKLVRL